MQTSQGYIFCILQHFVTKFCSFTNFNKFFAGIYFFLPKSKISLTCKLPIVAVRFSPQTSYLKLNDNYFNLLIKRYLS